VKRWLWPLIGLVLIGLAIWFLGPYIAIGDFKPFESLIGRAIALGVVMLFWPLLTKGLGKLRTSLAAQGAR